MVVSFGGLIQTVCGLIQTVSLYGVETRSGSEATGRESGVLQTVKSLRPGGARDLEPPYDARLTPL